MKASWVAVARCGLHSGIPKCCIRFFIREFDTPRREQFREHIKAARLHWGPNEFNRARLQYVQCPGCFAAGRPPVEIQPCPSQTRGCQNFEGRRREGKYGYCNDEERAARSSVVKES